MPTSTPLTPATKESYNNTKWDWKWTHWWENCTNKGNDTGKHPPVTQYPDSPAVNKLNEHGNESVRDRWIYACEGGVECSFVVAKVVHKSVERVVHYQNCLHCVKKEKKMDYKVFRPSQSLNGLVEVPIPWRILLSFFATWFQYMTGIEIRYIVQGK